MFYKWRLNASQQRFLRWVFRHSLLMIRRVDRKMTRLAFWEREHALTAEVDQTLACHQKENRVPLVTVHPTRG